LGTICPAEICTSYLRGKETNLVSFSDSFLYLEVQELLCIKNFDVLNQRFNIHLQVLIDKALMGWKEYELELLRDKNDNVVIICSIENMDPMEFILEIPLR
jgi:carbamoyl-phosphate synthase large subunit